MTATHICKHCFDIVEQATSYILISGNLTSHRTAVDPIAMVIIELLNVYQSERPQTCTYDP